MNLDTELYWVETQAQDWHYTSDKVIYSYNQYRDMGENEKKKKSVVHSQGKVQRQIYK